MPGRHLPADHSKGDANTIGGYMAAHDRPAAFEGPDGLSYSVEILTDATGDAARPVGAYFLFLRWRRVGAQGVDGHVETDFLARGDDDAAARAALGAWSLADTRAALLGCLERSADTGGARRWWDVMKEEG
jgi:hypothetical protein